MTFGVLAGDILAFMIGIGVALTFIKLAYEVLK